MGIAKFSQKVGQTPLAIVYTHYQEALAVRGTNHMAACETAAGVCARLGVTQRPRPLVALVIHVFTDGIQPVRQLGVLGVVIFRPTRQPYSKVPAADERYHDDG